MLATISSCGIDRLDRLDDLHVSDIDETCKKRSNCGQYPLQPS